MTLVALPSIGFSIYIFSLWAINTLEYVHNVLLYVLQMIITHSFM